MVETEAVGNQRICLVTGATAGIGLETVRAIARRGYMVIGVGRNTDKCQRLARQVREECNNPNVEYLTADLSIQAQVRALAAEYRRRYGGLHVLVNNAGGYFAERKESADGLEMTFALNHLNYFLLTNLLLDMLKANGRSTQRARIVNVSSHAHVQAKLNFDDLQNRKRYFGFAAYAQSKLCNVLFTYELARRLKNAPVTVNAVHPGMVATNFGASPHWSSAVLRWLMDRIALNAVEGARPSVRLAVGPDVEGITGKYFNRTKEAQSGQASYNLADALRLWLVSEHMTGLSDDS